MRDDELDKLIDQALADYTEPQFPVGLEQRVLNRVSAATLRRRFDFPKWAFAVPLLAALVVTAGIVWRYRQPVPQPPTAVGMRPKAVPPANWAAKPQIAAPVKPALRRKHQSQPKQPTFPAPAPMTAEERALVAFIQTAPQQAHQVLSEMARSGMEPIGFEEIRIQPLENTSFE